MHLSDRLLTLAAAFVFGASAARAALPFTESFDAVTPPALPAGWTTTASGAQSNWVTSTSQPDTAPHAAVAPNVTARGTAELLSPVLAIDSPSAELTFRLAYNLEETFDGLVLEIKVGAGEFLDLLDAGGGFVSGGYVTNLSTCCSNPLPNRLAWSGLSGGTTNAPAYRTVIAKLPASASGQNAQLRWVLGCDVSEAAGGAAGVWLDGVSISVPPPIAPTAVTVAAGPVGASSATLNGSVNPGRAPTSVYFDFGTTAAYGQRTATNVLPAGNFAVPVAAAISGLTLGQTYHYRVVAMNSEGGATGSNLTFTTVPSAPSVTTLPADDIAFGSASFNATVNPNGAATAAFFQFGFDTTYGLETVATNLGSGASPVTFHQSLAGLAPGATYHFRVVATNALGTNAGADFTFSTPPAFTNIQAGLPGVLRGSVSWADADNDGRLDLFLAGLSGSNNLAQWFRNAGDGSLAADTNALLPGVVNGAAAWADYDRDGDLDLLLTGTTNGAAIGAICRVYRNPGNGAFAATPAAVLPGVFYSAAAWGDYDNDGLPDALVSGLDTNGVPVTQLHRNLGGGAFALETAAVLPPLAFGSAAWGDYDNDGRLDLLLCGQTTGGAALARVYRNDGGGVFAQEPGASLPGIQLGAAAWADFDADGRLDLALAGTTNGAVDGALARVYRNTGSGGFSNVNAALPGVMNAALAWGDADNDGLPDLLLTGTTNGLASGAVSRVFRGGAFDDLFAPLPGVYLGAAAWGDYDADGRLDLALSGAPDFTVDPIAQVFHNNLILTNARPSAPSGLGDGVTNNSVVLTWSAAADAQTTNSAGLTYNIRVGRSAGAADVLAPQADTGSGFRRLPAAGNAQHRSFLPLTNLALGTYHWSVQAVDPAFAGSAFATENTFTVSEAPPQAVTLDPTVIQTNAATLAGSAVPNGATTRAWFEFGLTTSYGSRTTTTNLGNGTGSVPVSLVATGLSLGSTYHCRLVASNSAGLAYGSNRTFSTLGPPAVVTLAAGGLSATGATLNATVNPNFSATLAFFEWGSSTNYGNTTAVTNVGAGGAAVSVRAAITGLTAGSNYHFRVVATNLAGVARGANEQFSILFTNLPAGIPPVSLGAVAWGDADGDGALDLLVTGSTNGTASGALTRVYRNQGGGAFSNLNAGLPGLMNSAAAWGDFDNDGDLDLLLAGTTNGAPAGAVTRVYRNNGAGAFADAGVALSGVFGGSATWADFDNDGQLDVLLTGYEPGLAGGLAEVFLNRGGDGFVPQGAGFTGVYGSLTGGSSAAVADDFDQDGWLDVVVNGSTNGQPGGASTRLYRNLAGTGFALETNATLPGVFSGALAVGDENADGFPDLLVAGTTNGLASGAIAQILRNAGGGFFNLAASLTGVVGSLGGAGNAAAAWADHDNDGRMDALLCGTPTGSAADTASRVHRNLGGGAFASLDLGLPGVGNGAAVAWGDADQDGRLDVALMGVGAAGRVFQVLRNVVPATNAPPSAPTNLAAVVVNNGASLSWNAAGDAQTPLPALTHNLRVGTTPGGVDIVSPQARLADGRRRVPQPGNARSGATALLTNLPLGMFHWSVQSVDAAFAGSAFAVEGSFVVSNAPPSVATLAAGGVTSTSAVLNASVTPNALATVAWFEFGATPTLGSATAATNLGSGTTLIALNAEVSGLLAGAAHYFRAVASNSAGLVAGATRTFVTAGAPFVTTLPAESISGTNATLRGVVTPNQLPTMAWFEWGTNTGYGQATMPASVGSGGSAVNVAEVLAGLMSGVVYHYRLAASNELGVAYGDDEAFVTIYGLPYAENFDGVAAPALPVGWTTARSGAQSNWIALASGADSPSNAVFAPNVPAVGVAELTSPPVFISSDVAQLTFRAAFNLEAGFDGMALELKLGTNAFLDALTAGGAFVAGGYTTNLPVNGSNPLKGRAVWSGLSGGASNAPAYVTVALNLPASASGQVAQLRWVVACDNTGVAPGDAGARVDSVAITVPSPEAPLAVTLAASGLTVTGAVLNAAVTPNRQATTAWFEWGATTNYGLTTLPVSAGAGSFDVAVSNALSGLTPGTTYHFRAVASNALGVAFGGNQSFAISPLAPSGITLAASNVTSTGARLNAAVSPNGSAAAGWFEYGLTTNYGSVTPATPLGAGVGALNFSETVTGLAIGTLYHFRAVATNGIGAGYGANQTFTTVAAFTNAGAGLAGIQSGNAAWGDYDNDGDLDLVTLGQSGATGLTRVYRNTGGGVFSLETNAVLPGLLHGVAAWGDFDNDGVLDLALTGTTNGFASGAISRLYRNAGGGVFVWNTNTALAGLYFSALAWGDFDNDGDLDLALAGTTNGTASGARTEVYRNDGAGVFTSFAGAMLPGVFSGALALGDFDNDERLDLLLAGSPPAGVSASPITRVYRNTGAGFALASNAILPGVAFGAAAWGEADNDGDLDLLLAGTTNSLTSGAIARVYRNDGSGAFTNLNAGLPGVFGTTSGGNCAVAWGDYDADGTLDVALAGSTNGAAGGALARLYRNAGGGAFSTLNAGLPGVVQASAAWGDADDDGRLDLLLTGLSSTGRVAGIFRNTQPATNTPPAVPSGLMAAVNNNSAALSWTAGSDAQTAAAGLTYSLRLGSAPGASDLGAAHADAATGRRRLPQPGGAQHGLSALLTNLSLGTYYWSAQAVDAGFAGSPFAVEGSFSIVIATPEVTTGPVTGLDTNRATLNGMVNPSGAGTLAWFELGTNIALGTVLAPMAIGSGTNDVPLAAEADGLSTGTTYFYRLAASNQVGVVFGAIRSFTTLDRPSVVTLPASSLTGTGAVLNATVNPNQALTAAWFEWGTDTNYGNVTAAVSAGAGFSNVNVSVALTGLTAGVVYHFRAVATNGAGQGLGEDRTFVVYGLPFAEDFDAVTAPALPVGWIAAATGAGTAWAVATNAPDSAPHAAFTTNASAVGTTELVTPGILINSESALLTFRQRFNFEAGFDGLVLEIRIGAGAFTDIVTAGGLFVAGGYNTNLVLTGVNPLRGRAAWSGLSGGTTSAPAFLTTSVYLPPGANSNIVQLRWLAGTDGSTVAPGAAGAAIDEVAITVPAPAAPAAVTLAATLLTPASATLNALVNPNRAATRAWFQWGATTNYGNTTPALALGGGPAAIAVSNLLSGLAAGSAYHYRVAASNAVGLAFGDDHVFQTAPRPAISGAGIQTNGLFRLQFTGSPDASYSVLAATNLSTNLAQWTLIGAATNAGGGLFQFVDPATTNLPRRFYLLRSP